MPSWSRSASPVFSPSTRALVNTDGDASRLSASSPASKAYSIALDAVITARPRPPNCCSIPTSVLALGIRPRSNAPVAGLGLAHHAGVRGVGDIPQLDRAAAAAVE